MDQTIKSSPVPILFFSFNNNDEKCSYCENTYSVIPFYEQKYCKICLSKYIKEITDSKINEYLDIHTNIENTQCCRHKTGKFSGIQNTQEWYKDFSKILYFKQIITDDSFISKY